MISIKNVINSSDFMIKKYIEERIFKNKSVLKNNAIQYFLIEFMVKK